MQKELTPLVREVCLAAALNVAAEVEERGPRSYSAETSYQGCRRDAKSLRESQRFLDEMAAASDEREAAAVQALIERYAG